MSSSQVHAKLISSWPSTVNYAENPMPWWDFASRPCKGSLCKYVSPLRSSEPALMSTEKRNNPKAPNALLSAADARWRAEDNLFKYLLFSNNLLQEIAIYTASTPPSLPDPTSYSKEPGQFLLGGWWNFSAKQDCHHSAKVHCFPFLTWEKKTQGTRVSTELVKPGLCLFGRPRNSPTALLTQLRVKPLLFSFHYKPHTFRSNRCHDFLVKLNERLSCIL